MIDLLGPTEYCFPGEKRAKKKLYRNRNEWIDEIVPYKVTPMIHIQILLHLKVS